METKKRTLCEQVLPDKLRNSMHQNQRSSHFILLKLTILLRRYWTELDSRCLVKSLKFQTLNVHEGYYNIYKSSYVLNEIITLPLY